jgi:protein-S-isoprenylcysteine O-methyltransferase Ste14
MTEVSPDGERVPEHHASEGGAERHRASLPDEARRRVRRNRILIVVVATAAALALGLALATYAPASLRQSSDPAPTLQVLGVVLVAVGLVAAVVGLVRGRRTGAIGLAWNSPSALLPRAERKRLIRLIRLDQVVDAAQQEPAVAMAGQLIKQRALLPMYGGFLLYVAGESVLASSPLSRWPAAVAVVLIAVALPLVVRDARRAQRWLDHHAAEAG